MQISFSHLISLIAALLLLVSFLMLTQRRLLNLIRLLAWQGLILTINMVLIAFTVQDKALYVSALLTFLLKVWLIPFVLRRLLYQLKMNKQIKQLANVPTILLIGLGLVIFALTISVPIAQLTSSVDKRTILAFALACVLLSTFMMIVRRNAMSQVVGLLALENSLFFVATSVTYSLPLIVELGIAFDVLIAVFVFGIFFFQIRDTFDSLDIRNLEKLKDV